MRMERETRPQQTVTMRLPTMSADCLAKLTVGGCKVTSVNQTFSGEQSSLGTMRPNRNHKNHKNYMCSWSICVNFSCVSHLLRICLRLFSVTLLFEKFEVLQSAYLLENNRLKVDFLASVPREMSCFPEDGFKWAFPLVSGLAAAANATPAAC